MDMSLPDLRVSSSSFFDYDFTYLTLIHHLLLYIGTDTLTWNLFTGGGSELSDHERTHGISHKMLIIYSLAFSARMIEYLVPLHDFTYDFAICSGFTGLYWLATIFWMVYQQGETWGDRVGLKATLFVTAGLAYSFNYDGLDEFTPSLFCWAWSHYLEGVAMIPQLWTMTCLHKEGRQMSNSVWTGVHLTAMARVFQLLNWIYLYFDADILDHLQVAAASFYLLSYGVFLLTILYQALTNKNKDDINTDVDLNDDSDDKTKKKSE